MNCTLKEIIWFLLCVLAVGIMCGCAGKSNEKKNDANDVVKIPDKLDTDQQDLSKLRYSESFAVLMAKIKKDYKIAKVKGFDADKFYREHLAELEKAEKEKNETLYYRVLFTLSDMLGEAHAGVSNRDAASASLDYFAGNDYGLSLIGMTDGRTVAINVEKDGEAYNAGIRNGMVITAWDGKKIDEWREQTDVRLPSLLTIPVKASKEIFKPFFIAGKGGDSINVSFETKNGEEKEVTLNKTGGYSERLNEVLDLFQNRQRNNDKVNFGWKILEGNQGYIVINSERVTTKDNSSYPEWTEKIKTAVKKMKKKKTEELIEQIKVKFPGNKIMILSTSWGSILSAKLLEKNPYAVDSVIACGQIIKNGNSAEDSDEFFRL